MFIAERFVELSSRPHPFGLAEFRCRDRLADGGSEFPGLAPFFVFFS
jgi:hypothetical protein